LTVTVSVSTTVALDEVNVNVIVPLGFAPTNPEIVAVSLIGEKVGKITAVVLGVVSIMGVATASGVQPNVKASATALRISTEISFSCRQRRGLCRRARCAPMGRQLALGASNMPSLMKSDNSMV
jgi:hypothetical protein